MLVANDNWRDTQETEIIASGFQPQDVLPADPKICSTGSFNALVKPNWCRDGPSALTINPQLSLGTEVIAATLTTLPLRVRQPDLPGSMFPRALLQFAGKGRDQFQNLSV